MMSQISAPCCDSDLNLTSLRVKYGKVTFGNKFSSSLKMFIVKGKKIQLGFDNKYPIRGGGGWGGGGSKVRKPILVIVESAIAR